VCVCAALVQIFSKFLMHQL